MDSFISEFLEIISKYDILNSFFPGVAFCVILRWTTPYNLLAGSTFEDIFICYLAGMILNRVGSLFLSTVLRKFCKKYWSSYKEYSESSQQDEYIKILNDENNLYRTLIIMFIALAIIKLSHLLFYNIINKWTQIIIFIALSMLFAFSYRKRAMQIQQRIFVVKSKKNDCNEKKNVD